jgi:hypothetical protein
MQHTGFRWLTGDVNWNDHGGMWIRPGSYSGSFEVVEFMPWSELDSSADCGVYNVQIANVDLDSAGGYSGPHDKNATMSQRSTLENALRSCGWELQADGSILDPHSGDEIATRESRHYTDILVECLHRFGHKDVSADISGDNAYALLRQAGVYRPNAHLRPRKSRKKARCVDCGGVGHITGAMECQNPQDHD